VRYGTHTLEVSVHRSRVLTVLALVGPLIAAQAAAQTAPDATSPADVARLVYTLVDGGNWPGAAALLDPEAMADFQREQVEHARAMARWAEARPEGTGGAPPVGGDLLLRYIYKVRTPDELAALPPATVTARMLAAKHRRHRSRPRGPPTPPEPLVTRVVVGSVAEGDSLAHVVLRTRIEGAAVPLPSPVADAADVLTLRRTAAGWRAQLNGGLIYGAGGSFAIGYDADEEDDR
jgi:hypothetical protein